MRKLLAGAAFFAAFGVGASSALADFNYTFDANTQGWASTQNIFFLPITPEPPGYSASGGNPGGYISLTDGDSGSQEHLAGFTSPILDPGGALANYGGTLSFDIKDSSPGTAIPQDPTTLIMLRGRTSAPDGTLYPIYHTDVGPPTTSFATHTLTLAPGSGWFGPDAETPANELDVQYVLANLDEVDVLADYYDGPAETTSLDNVHLTGGSAPAKLSFDREASIKIGKKAVAGKVTVKNDQFSNCDGVDDNALRVNLLFKKKQKHGHPKFKNIGHDFLDFNHPGAFSIKFDHKKGTYYVQAPQEDLQGGNLDWTCNKAKSETAKVK